ncbi:MAG: hypothetical protein Q8M94_05635 [Ignavibacteria bacterium]|nr:hypothetical protein [Ignavibacteria bacterium]
MGKIILKYFDLPAGRQGRQGRFIVLRKNKNLCHRHHYVRRFH